MQSKTFSDPAGWNDIPCNRARTYICESKAVAGTSITTPRPTREFIVSLICFYLMKVYSYVSACDVYTTLSIKVLVSLYTAE